MSQASAWGGDRAASDAFTPEDARGFLLEGMEPEIEWRLDTGGESLAIGLPVELMTERMYGLSQERPFHRSLAEEFMRGDSRFSRLGCKIGARICVLPGVNELFARRHSFRAELDGPVKYELLLARIVDVVRDELPGVELGVVERPTYHSVTYVDPAAPKAPGATSFL